MSRERRRRERERARPDEVRAGTHPPTQDDHEQARIARETAERRLEHSLMVRLDAFMARRSPGFIVVLGFLLLVLCGLLDAVTRSFDVAPLYLLPVGLVTFSRGRWLGAIMAMIATLARGAAEVARDAADLASQVPYWSGLTRFYVFMVVVLMVGPMRDVLRWQRELTDTLAEANARTQVLDELRGVMKRNEQPARYRALEELAASIASMQELKLPQIEAETAPDDHR